MIRDKRSTVSSFSQLLFLEIRKRSLNTAIGWIWSLVNPTVQIAIIYFVTTVVFQVNRPNLALWLLTTMSTWVAIQAAILRGANSAVARRSLLLNTNVSLRKLVLIDVLSELCILIPFFFVGLILALSAGVDSWRFVFIVPSVLVIALFSYLMALAFASVTPIFRDIPYLLAIVLQVVFWISPVISARRETEGLLRTLMDWNPFTYVLETTQFVFQNNSWTIFSLLAPFIVCLLLFFPAMKLSERVFRRAVTSL